MKRWGTIFAVIAAVALVAGCGGVDSMGGTAEDDGGLRVAYLHASSDPELAVPDVTKAPVIIQSDGNGTFEGTFADEASISCTFINYNLAQATAEVVDATSIGDMTNCADANSCCAVYRHTDGETGNCSIDAVCVFDNAADLSAEIMNFDIQYSYNISTNNVTKNTSAVRFDFDNKNSWDLFLLDVDVNGFVIDPPAFNFDGFTAGDNSFELGSLAADVWNIFESSKDWQVAHMVVAVGLDGNGSGTWTGEGTMLTDGGFDLSPLDSFPTLNLIEGALIMKVTYCQDDATNCGFPES